MLDQNNNDNTRAPGETPGTPPQGEAPPKHNYEQPEPGQYTTPLPPPPPPRDGFFNERQEPPRKSGNGCFWALIIGIITVFVVVIVMIGVVIAGALSTLQTSLGEIGDAGFANKSKYTEAFISGKRTSKNKIAVVYVRGIISSGEGGGFSSANASSRTINSKLRHILKDKSIKALIVRIDSPGGEVTASDEIYHMLMRIRQERNIPVVASMGSLAASGGYYIACGCSTIIAHRMTTTGSIGVIVQTYKYYDMFQKIGLKGEAYTSGPMKAMLSGDRPTTIQEKAIVQRLVMDVYNDFVNVVAKGRPQLTVEKIKDTKIGDGRVFLGIQAAKLGLVDELGYFEDAVTKAAKMANLTDYKVVSLNVQFTLAALFGQVESKSNNLNIQLPGSNGFRLEKGKIYLLPSEYMDAK